jgi:signal transduction histidine kinase
VSLDVDVPADQEVTTRADPDRLAQVVANLVENALGFARSRVTVGTHTHGADVLVAVEDDGPGISADDLPHVFEPFYRSKAPPARRLGTGLGLAIVRELVAAMGGSVRVDPAPAGSGTRVVVNLPQWRAGSA